MMHLFDIPIKLLDTIIYFSIRVRSFKRALRLRLVNRKFGNLVKENMFRIRFLDQSIRSMRAGSSFVNDLNHHRPTGQDLIWLPFLREYFAHHIYIQPNLHPKCPENLIHSAVDWLGESFNDSSDRARRHYIKTICQVAFWETCCCFKRLLSQPCDPFVDDSSDYIDSTLNASAKYGGDAPWKMILLEAAIYLGDIDLAKKVYALEPVEDYQYTYTTSQNYNQNKATESLGDRLRLSVAHGGLEMFKLVNRIELGIETNDQYSNYFEADNLMEYIIVGSRNNASSSLINFLIDAGDPWDAQPNSYWMKFDFAYALVHARSPDVFERLSEISGPEASALSANSARLCCRKDGMLFHLDRSAAANNLVMVKYLLDHGGVSYLNNTHTECEPRYQQSATARLDRPTGNWQQWLLNPLVRAVEVGNTEMIKLMLARGANPNHNQYETPLMAAVRYPNIGIASLLIEHGANPNIGSTPPIVLAVQGENLSMIKFLLEKGACINTPTTGGKAMGIVEREGLDSMRNILVNEGVEINAIWNHVQSEEEYVLGMRYCDISVTYGFR